MILNVLKVFAPSAISFTIGIAITPMLTYYLYKHRMWKKRSGKRALDGADTPIFNGLHKKREVGTPRMGGIIIWASTLATIGAIWLISILFPSDLTQKLDFLSRNQTWLPLFMLMVGSFIGLIDDWMQVRDREGYIGGLSFWKRLFVVVLLGLAGAWWFYARLEMSSVHLPFYGDIFLGIYFIPFFVAVMLALFSSSVIDGLDGLAGGVMAAIFASFAGIAFFQNQIDLAAFCLVVLGGILAFLWFNIPPARFYMSETGILGLTTTLTVVAFLTDSVLVLPVIALPLLITSFSVIIQLLSKRFRHGKKIFLVAPLHHHFEAIGWPPYKVVMRYWVISIVMAIIGMIIAIIG